MKPTDEENAALHAAVIRLMAENKALRARLKRRDGTDQVFLGDVHVADFVDSREDD